MGSIGIPPFPDDLPVAPLQRISLAKLTRGDEAESERLLDACLDYGFFLLELTDDSDGQELLNNVADLFDVSKEFFAQELDVKKEFGLSPGNVGYKPMGAIKYADGRSDLTELCGVGRDMVMNPDVAKIPQVFDRERALLKRTTNYVHPICSLILKHLSQHLDVPFSTFETLHETSRPSSTVLRFLHYPPQVVATPADKQTALPGHTDSGTLTVLFTQLGGLQVLNPDGDESDPQAWRWVRPEPGCAIINVGDTLVQWTGGIFRSAFHRVLYAPGEQGALDRYSFGYFLKPAGDAPMNRIQEGDVIPRLKDASEKEDDEQMSPYDLWHQDKSKKIMKGHQNGVSRGGTAKFRRKNSAYVWKD